MPVLNWKNCYDCPIPLQLKSSKCPFLDRSVIMPGRKADIEPDCPFINCKTNPSKESLEKVDVTVSLNGKVIYNGSSDDVGAERLKNVEPEYLINEDYKMPPRDTPLPRTIKNRYNYKKINRR